MPYIAIEGPIGVGKTTLAKGLAKHFSASKVLEKVDPHLLEDFYRGKPEALLKTQFYFLIQRYEQLPKIRQGLSQGGTVITDYTFEKTLIFSKVILEAQDFQLFSKYYNLLASSAEKPDVVVYLQASCQNLLQRIQKRGRSYERKIKRDYLMLIHQAYQEHMFSHPPERLLIINTDHVDLSKETQRIEVIGKAILHCPFGVNYYSVAGSPEDL